MGNKITKTRLVIRILMLIVIVAVLVKVAMIYISTQKWDKYSGDCFENKDSVACQALIDNGLKSVEQCNFDCAQIAWIYQFAGKTQEAIKYYKKAFDLGDIFATQALGLLYYKNKDFANAKKYTEIACEKIDVKQDTIGKAGACYNLGLMYSKGEGVRQNFQKAFQYYKYSCDLGAGGGCNNLGVLYGSGRGTKRNMDTAKKYYGKACDLGNQTGCDNYRQFNEAGL